MQAMPRLRSALYWFSVSFIRMVATQRSAKAGRVRFRVSASFSVLTINTGYHGVQSTSPPSTAMVTLMSMPQIS